jgi:predicted nucleic acid-binding protein
VLAPSLLWPEVLNVIHRRRYRAAEDALTPEEAEEAVERFLAYPITAVEHAGLSRTAYTLARTYQLPSIYDATYLALAQLLGVELWTDDTRLRNALGGRLSWVRWIGDYPLPPSGGQG